MENKVLFVLFGMFVFGFLLFGCTQYTQAKPNATTNQSVNQTPAVPTMTCEEYCPTQSHVQCVGIWNISGAYPNCNCQYNCQTLEENKSQENQSQQQQNQSVQPELLTSASIDMINLAFNPSSIEVAKGATVIWTNKDSYIHIVALDNGAFSSDMIYTGRTASYTFNATGTYPYHCAIHTSMKGTIIVK